MMCSPPVATTPGPANVGAPTGHVGGNGHRTLLPGLGDNLGLFFVLLGIEHFMLDTLQVEHPTEALGFFNGRGSYQHRLPLLMAFFDLLHHGLELFGFVFIDIREGEDMDGRRFCRSRTIIM